MPVDSDRLAERLAAVERRLTDADAGEGLADAAAIEGRLAELEERADDLDERVGELERGLQALRGYVGGVDAVDESVERRAEAALAKVEKLESRLVDEPDLAVERVPVDGGDGHGGDAPLADGDDADGTGGTGGTERGGGAGGRRLVDRLRDAL